MDTTQHTNLSEVETDDLIAELLERRKRIDSALETNEIWRTRHSPVLEAAANAFGFSVGSLFLKNRTPRLCRARWIAIKLLETAGYGTSDIANIFGIAPATVTHGLRKFDELHESDPVFATRYSRVTAALNNQPEAETPCDVLA